VQNNSPSRIGKRTVCKGKGINRSGKNYSKFIRRRCTSTREIPHAAVGMRCDV